MYLVRDFTDVPISLAAFDIESKVKVLLSSRSVMVTVTPLDTGTFLSSWER